MVKGKRPVLALLLALCMIVMLLPATVFAEGENGTAEATNNPSGEDVIAVGTTNGGAGDQTVGAATTDTADKPEGAAAKNVADKPEGSAAKDATDKSANGITDKPEGTAAKGVATRGVTDQPGEGEIAPYADIEDGIIKRIRIDNAKLTFKPGEVPMFTAKVADGYDELYTLYCQDWSLGSWKGSKLKAHAASSMEDTLKEFEKDKTYKYSLFVSLTDQAREERLQFADNVELILNGKTITGVDSDRAYDTSVIFYDVAEMTPTEVIPEQGSMEPGTVDQGKDNNIAAKTESKGKKNDSSAKTGDDANPVLWAGILLLAAAGAGTAVFYRRKADH